MKHHLNVVAKMILSVLSSIHLVLGMFNESFLSPTDGLSYHVTNNRPKPLLFCHITNNMKRYCHIVSITRLPILLYRPTNIDPSFPSISHSQT